MSETNSTPTLTASSDTHTTLPDHIDYDLGRRTVRFHSLTKPEVENIARDIEDDNKLSVSASMSLTAFVTFGIEFVVNNFSQLPSYGQAVLALGLPTSGAFSIYYGIRWLKQKKPVRRIIEERLKEIDAGENEDTNPKEPT